MNNIAEVSRRIEAFLIDLFLSFFIYTCIYIIFNSLTVYSSNNFYFKYLVFGNIYIISWWIYHTLSFFILGESLGKVLRGIKVVKLNTKLEYGLRDIFLRELVFRFVDYYLFGYLWCFFNSRRRCLHDFLIGTVVVKVDSQRNYNLKLCISTPIILLSVIFIFFKSGLLPSDIGRYSVQTLKGSKFIQNAYSQSELEGELNRKFKNVSSKDLRDQEYIKKRIINNYKDIVYFPDRYEISDENLRLFISTSAGRINHASNSMLNSQKYLRWNLEFLSKKNDRKNEFLQLKNKIEVENKLKFKAELSSLEDLSTFISRSPEELKYIPLEFFNEVILSRIRKLNVKHLLLLSKEVKQSQIFKKFIIENDLNDELYILTDKKSLEMIERKKRDEIEKFKKKVVFLSNRSVDNSNLFNLKINNTWYLDRDFTNFILKHIPAKVATLPDFAKFDKILAREALKESFKKSIRSGNIRGPILNDSYNHFLCFTKDPSSISLFKFKKKLDYSFLNKVLNHNRTAIQEILEINIDDKKLWDLALDSWSYDEMPSGRLRRSLIGYVPRKLLSNNAFVLDVLNTDPVSIYFLPKDVSLKLKGTDIANFKDRARNQFISEIRNLKRPELVEYRLSAFKNDKEIAEIIIANENLSHYFYLFSEKVRFDRAISKNALSANIDNYPWVSSELRSMKDNILKYAVYSTRMYTPFLNNPFFKDRDFVIEYLALLSSTKSRRYTFRKTYIHKSLISDPGIKEYLQMYYP